MRRVCVLLVAFILVVSGGPALAVAAGAPVAADGSVGGEGQLAEEPEDDGEWREYEPDDELGLEGAEELSDEELAEVIDRAMVRVEELREVEFEERPPVEVVTRSEFQEEFDGLVGEGTETQTAFVNAKHKALLLVGDDEDSTETLAENQNVSVGGFYSSATNEIVVVVDDETPVVDEVILAHELYHAYQDQRWDLQRYDAQTRDERNAQNGLIEGDAVLMEYRYEQRCEGGEWECVRPPAADGTEPTEEGEPANMGLLLLDFQPYSDGPTFSEHRYQEGGWDAVNELYGEPPETSQQVITPDRYPDDLPREVEIDDETDEGWDRLRPEERPDHEVLGKVSIATMFAAPLYDQPGAQLVDPDEFLNVGPDGELDPFDPINYDVEYATGWDGDRLHVYESEAGESAYVWRIAWESDDDAATFVEGYDELLEYRGAGDEGDGLYVAESGGYAGAYHVDHDGDVVTITHAPDVDALSAVNADVEPADVEEDDEVVETPEETDDDVEETPEETDDDVEETPEEEQEEQPGFGLVAALAALVIALALLARRR
ncbi:Hvo_1808 family surface protein [Natronorarus salvus]|uniref:Hvo_1808 family surface protein n=1 Tax=Natronorarus salvus TaxID=3117733 RepID=UPI002F268017